jgi:hypothetical protein
MAPDATQVARVRRRKNRGSSLADGSGGKRGEVVPGTTRNRAEQVRLGIEGPDRGAPSPGPSFDYSSLDSGAGGA